MGECENHDCKNKGTFPLGYQGKIRMICTDHYRKMVNGEDLDFIPFKIAKMRLEK